MYVKRMFVKWEPNTCYRYIGSLLVIVSPLSKSACLLNGLAEDINMLITFGNNMNGRVDAP